MAYRDALASFADRERYVVLAPLFPVGPLGDGNPDGYKYIAEGDIRYDRLLLDMVAEVEALLDNSFPRFDLFGFSGGGHYVHRFYYLHPDRLSSVTVGAPGSMTLIDDTQDFWLGTRDWEQRFGTALDLQAMKRVPSLLLVGADDTQGVRLPGQLCPARRRHGGARQESRRAQCDIAAELARPWAGCAAGHRRRHRARGIAGGAGLGGVSRRANNRACHGRRRRAGGGSLSRLADTVNIIVPTGALGTGVRAADLAAGAAAGAHAIACDAGSTDSGPAYLATAQPKYSRGAVKTDLRLLMLAQAEHGIPLLIGSCGTSGADAALDWTRDIALEIAREEGLTPTIALLYSEQEPARIAAAAAAGRVRPLAPLTSAESALFEECDRIVALMGPEPYIEAIRAGADIVLGGRTTDTAVIAAVPLMMDAGAGPAWHAGKIAECGGLCTRFSREGGVLVRIGTDAFESRAARARTMHLRPLHGVRRTCCTKTAILSCLTEPGGVLDVSAARYAAADRSRRSRSLGARTRASRRSRTR